MKEKTKTIIAFTLLMIALLSGLLLPLSDRSSDVYPNEKTLIRLYGEAHGSKEYYDLEFNLWKECYDQGYRSLFLELPYYSGEFLNLWMKEADDDIIDRFYEDIQGTQSGNQYYLDFFHRIKEGCPQTVFFATDVGHQNESTGARYLKYLEDNGLKDSENYRLAQECMAQGDEFYADEKAGNGISEIRERYMVDNFIKAYERCGSQKIMGIYGSYHTDLHDPEVMGGRLQKHYGDIISSVRMSTIAFGKNEPYRLGFSITGLLFMVMLMVPNIYWAKNAKPEGYEEAARKENRILLSFERIGEVLTTTALLIFPAINPHVRLLKEGLFFEWNIIHWFTALLLMILYEGYWLKYFRSERKLMDQYRSYAGFPLAGATLPVLAVFFLGLYSKNLIIIVSALILGIGHIGIHYNHRKEALDK